MSKNPLIEALNTAAEDLKDNRYTGTDPLELASALQGIATELAYHLDSLKVFDTNAIDAFRQHQDVGIPGMFPSSAGILLTGTLQVFIDSTRAEESK
ncbi:hypothetical protein [Glutamicibacter ardleyensis]|uniref:hypothetical protein n=1 Tax=Glutamicibacter ardleyensis TaxID=225894 RepID=UPI003FD44D45